MARSCRTAQPRRSRGASEAGGAPLPSGAAPPGPGVGAGAEPQPPAQPGRDRHHQPGRQVGSKLGSQSPAAAPAASTAAARQGRPRVQVARSPARRRRYSAWAEAPGRPTLARTRTATTGPPGPAAARPAVILVLVVLVEVGEQGLEVGRG